VTPSLAVQFSAAANGRKITVDEDVLLLGVVPSTNAVRFVVSKDSATTIANAITAPADTTDENIIAIVSGFTQMPMAFPLTSGSAIFVSSSAAGSLVLLFGPVVS
jgi:hypothetical protein